MVANWTECVKDSVVEHFMKMLVDFCHNYVTWNWVLLCVKESVKVCVRCSHELFCEPELCSGSIWRSGKIKFYNYFLQFLVSFCDFFLSLDNWVAIRGVTTRFDFGGLLSLLMKLRTKLSNFVEKWASYLFNKRRDLHHDKWWFSDNFTYPWCLL